MAAALGMDKLNHYRKIIQEIVAKHAQYKPSHGEIEAIPICDLEHDNYLLMAVSRSDKTGSLVSFSAHRTLQWLH